MIEPLPNHLFTRDSSAWLYGSVMISSTYRPARRREILNVEAIYRFHPRFRDAGVEITCGGFDHDWGKGRDGRDPG